jgi:cytochrome c556
MQRMEAKHYSRAVTMTAALCVTIIAVASGGAQQPPAPASTPPPAPPQDQRPAAPAPAAQPAARPSLPAAASSIAAKPEAYYGQYVSVYATVEKSVAPLAFTMDQDQTKTTGQEVLVLAPRLHEPVQPNSYVTVLGEVVRPDAAEIAKRSNAAAGVAEILAQNPGRPVILATSVINGALTDLAKFRPPPMTPEETAFDKAMKAVGAANGALRKGVDGADIQLVKTNTAILAKAFTEAETFWKGRGKADAVKMTQDARAAVQTIETAAAAANWNDAKTQNTTLGQQCATCHGLYRERGDDGSFFINEKGRK